MRMWIAMLVSLPSLCLAAEDIDERRDMAADGTVTVSNVAGDIEVTTWDREELRLRGELGDNSELKIDASGGNVRIEVKPRKSGFQFNIDDSDLILSVPESANLSLKGVSSDISVAGARGARLAAETVSGDVEASGEVESLDLASVSGDVEFHGASMRTSAETVSGDIQLDGISGVLEVSLVSGDADIRGGRFSRGRFESVSGDLELYLEMEAGGRLTVETMSGDAYLYLPEGQGGEFSAQTFSGNIRSAFGSPVKEQYGPGSRLQHVVGDGGAEIKVESFSGDVEIRWQ